MKKRGLINKMMSAALSSVLAVSLATSFAVFSPVELLNLNAYADGETVIANAGFENDIWASDAGWSVTASDWEGDASVRYLNYANEGLTAASENSGEYYVNCWSPKQWVTFNFTQDISLKAGTYTFNVSGAGGDTEYMMMIDSSGDEVTSLAEGDKVTSSGWDVWNQASVTYTADEDKKVTLKISAWTTAESGGYISLDDVSYTYTANSGGDTPGDDPEPSDPSTDEPEVTRSFTFDTIPVSGDPVESELHVEKVSMMKDFITGADISSYRSIRNSGATFSDEEGHTLSDEGFFNLLRQSGVNYVRIRVWVDPKNSAGKYYGGGNCDLDTAKWLGRLATSEGLRVLIDFHYSDFWTDPGKYQAPKAWQNLSLDDKAKTLKTWTEESLTELIDAGVDVGMVQIGNETTNGFCGEKDRTNMCKLFSAGSEGIRNVEAAKNKDIMMAIHLTNPEPNGTDFDGFAKDLKDNGVIYDVFATSYYPYWHGTLSNLYSKLSNIASKYDKYVMVAETSYVRTLEDGDGHPNTVRVGKNDEALLYDVSEQGQVTHVRNVIEQIAKIPDNKGIGVFWWEPAWIPVQNYASSTDKDATLAENKALWEQYGSGWASSYSSDYDPEDAGLWYGGSAVDNESWFDFDGKVLESAKVFNMVRYGTTTDDYLIRVNDTSASFEEGDYIELPETVDAIYASGTVKSVAALWNESEIKAAKEAGTGEYEISGTVECDEGTFDVICKLTILPDNLLINPSFEEDSRTTDWTISGDGGNWNDMGSNSKTGDACLHFYSDSDFNFVAYQKLTLDKGIYTYGGYMQGETKGEDDLVGVYVGIDRNVLEDVTKSMTGWKNWANPEIAEFEIEEDGTEVTFGITVNATAESWGAFDDMYLYKVGDLSNEDEEEDDDYTYAFIDDEGNEIEGKYSHKIGDEKKVSIHIDADHTKLESVAVDGNELSADNYDVTEGSTIVTFAPDYLDTLSIGNHEVLMNYSTGKSAKATLEVLAADADDDDDESAGTDRTAGADSSSNSGSKSDSGSNSGSKSDAGSNSGSKSDAGSNSGSKSDTNSSAVKTGDTSPILMVNIILLVSVISIALILIEKKREKEKN